MNQILQFNVYVTICETLYLLYKKSKYSDFVAFCLMLKNSLSDLNYKLNNESILVQTEVVIQISKLYGFPNDVAYNFLVDFINDDMYIKLKDLAIFNIKTFTANHY